MRLLTLGDSWTYGTELWDPTLGPQEYYMPILHDEHHVYRNKNSWPARLGELLGASEIINLGWPGASNDTVIRRLMHWLTTEGYLSGRDGSDLFVVVGWTSPERKDIFLDDVKLIKRWAYCLDKGWTTLYPWWDGKHPFNELNEITEVYYKHWSNPGEYLHRYINQSWTVQHLMDSIGSKWFQFQSFWEHDRMHIDKWIEKDFKVTDETQLTNADIELWKLIDNVKYYNKHDPTCTFHNFVMSSGMHRDKVMLKTHPNALGHEIWAAELYRYIQDNNLI